MIYGSVKAWVKACNGWEQILYNGHTISSYKTSSLVLVFSDTVIKIEFIYLDFANLSRQDNSSTF